MARGTDEDGEGRLQSPWRSSMERLQGESMEASSPPDSDCSPSNLNTQTMTFTRLVIFNHSNDKKQEKKSTCVTAY